MKQILAFHEHENSSLRVHRVSFSQENFCIRTTTLVVVYNGKPGEMLKLNLLLFHYVIICYKYFFCFSTSNPAHYFCCCKISLPKSFQIREKVCADEICPLDIGNGSEVTEKCLYLQTSLVALLLQKIPWEKQLTP